MNQAAAESGLWLVMFGLISGTIYLLGACLLSRKVINLECKDILLSMLTLVIVMPFTVLVLIIILFLLGASIFSTTIVVWWVVVIMGPIIALYLNLWFKS